MDSELVFYRPECAEREFGGPVKLEEEVADTAVVVKRLRPKFLRVRDPVWRETLAVRVGLPVLGAVVAVTFAWLITQV